MGNAISAIPYALGQLLRNVRLFLTLSERVHAEPGLPVDNPTHSFWMHPPSPIAKHSSDLPQYADIVVIGSGITGTSVARHLLDQVQAEGKQLPVVLMLEARDACSGATGRNGGHIDARPYEDFTSTRGSYGDVAASKFAKFRYSHIEELRRAAVEEGIFEQSQWRPVDAVVVHFKREMFAKGKEAAQAYAKAFPSEASRQRVYESLEGIQRYHLAQGVAGCVACNGAAIHPYRFVTGVLSNLLRRYPNNFLLCTNTPCTSITGPSGLDPLYTVITSKGVVKTPHVIHATNAWSSQLLKPMRGKIVPFRGNMTAQRPGQSIPAETLQRSFSFYEIPLSYDYLTQLPSGEHEFMLGASCRQYGPLGHEALGNTDDSACNQLVVEHLGGALPRYFGEHNWGREGQPPEADTNVEWSQGRVKASWSGILGMSADLLPWVGRLSPSISGRPAPPDSQGMSVVIPTSPGEWIAAGYTGEGMVQAWMSGKALAEMVLGREREGNLAEWFPDMLRVSTERWKKADWVATLANFYGGD